TASCSHAMSEETFRQGRRSTWRVEKCSSPAASRERSCAPSLGPQVFLWLCWPALTCCSCVPPRMCSPSDPEPDPVVFLWLCCPDLTCCSCVPPRVCSPFDLLLMRAAS